ncbi:MAG: hypothetical protein DRI98_07665 [Bacteroidetes bacterium]|nr:MAG: hypothetical protein DRI98_07665 [Bacteroidota bacterium]
MSFFDGPGITVAGCDAVFVLRLEDDGSTSNKYQVDIDSRYYFKGTYQQWLKSQLKTDPGFVKDALGATRFKLFKAGKLSLAYMV